MLQYPIFNLRLPDDLFTVTNGTSYPVNFFMRSPDDIFTVTNGTSYPVNFFMRSPDDIFTVTNGTSDSVSFLSSGNERPRQCRWLPTSAPAPLEHEPVMALESQ